MFFLILISFRHVWINVHWIPQNGVAPWLAEILAGNVTSMFVVQLIVVISHAAANVNVSLPWQESLLKMGNL